MKIDWIHLFIESKIPFCAYKLGKGDSIILKKYGEYSLNAIILYGAVYTMKTFTNDESLLLAVLSAENIINSAIDYSDSEYAYIEVIALQQTYFLSFSWTDFICQPSNSSVLSIELVSLFQNTLKQYQVSSCIMAHKYVRNRIIQLLLFICQEFGSINNIYIAIPFEMSYSIIGHIAGANQVTVGRVMNHLIEKFLVKYTSKRKLVIQYFALVHYLYNDD